MRVDEGYAAECYDGQSVFPQDGCEATSNRTDCVYESRVPLMKCRSAAGVDLILADVQLQRNDCIIGPPSGCVDVRVADRRADWITCTDL